MNVLVINCGSSSLKYQLIDSDTEAVLAKGLCERIGIDGRLVYQKAGNDKEITEASMPTHKEAIQMVLEALTNEKTGAIKSLADDKANIGDYLDIFQFWFRDVLMFKATREIDNLVFKQEINYIREQASQRSYENLEKILDALEKTKVRLRANVNTELALELLFLTIREK